MDRADDTGGSDWLVARLNDAPPMAGDADAAAFRYKKEE
jgi:hypothetical protein